MLPIDTGNFVMIYPIQFTSPLPLVECKNRLQQSLGKAMGSLFTTIEGEVEMIDPTTCKFRAYQDVSKGGRQTIVGYLYAQSDSSTIVDAVFGIERTSQVVLVALVFVIGIITLRFPSTQLIIAALIFALASGSIFYLDRRNRKNPPRPPRMFKKEPMSQLLWWFERTLKN